MHASRPILVQKYGGSSVANPELLQIVARNVVAACERGYQVVVVVSAMGDPTNQLLDMAHQVTSEPPRRELDMLLSAGERISMALLSMAIQSHGLEAISLTGSQSGIITNDRHYEARIIEVRPVRIEGELAKGRVVIVAGFQGVSYKREITTLGRGGSDTTAVALAAALDAEACEIYTDVDGVYDADPRVNLDAERLSEISFREMEELARCGAKVLHAESVEFARRHNIALYVKSTKGSVGGTLIRKDRKADERKTFLAISCMPALTMLDCTLLKGQREQLFSLLEEHQLSPSFSDISSVYAELLFQRERCPNLESFQRSLAHELDTEVDVMDVAAVHVVGSDVGRDAALIRRCYALLAEGLDQLPIRLFVSPLRLSFVVMPKHVIDAQTLLYKIVEDKRHL